MSQEPFGWFHELVDHDGKPNGVFLGCSDKRAAEICAADLNVEAFALYTHASQPLTEVAHPMPVEWFRQHYYDPQTAAAVAAPTLVEFIRAVYHLLDDSVEVQRGLIEVDPRQLAQVKGLLDRFDSLPDVDSSTGWTFGPASKVGTALGLSIKELTE